MVTSPSELVEAVGHLEKQKVIGVDTEFNNSESYDGFLCLVQLTAYVNDKPVTYLIDTLQPSLKPILRREVGLKLLQNAKILKLMHGCIGSDIVWIMKELSI